MTLFSDLAAIRYLRSAPAIRERCGRVFAAAREQRLRHFRTDLSRLAAAADYVAAVIRENYPGLDVPLHSRWRHFAAGGIDRWGGLMPRLAALAPIERARVRFDLAVTSVLLDAGTGPGWRYREAATGAVYGRSEGLAVASFEMFNAGAFSDSPSDPLRADAVALQGLGKASLSWWLQSRRDNRLVGLDGRAMLLRRLGKALATSPELFGRERPRFGNLADYLAVRSAGGRLEAATVLPVLLEALAPVWPRRVEIGGVNLGDVGRHPAAGGEGVGAGLVPFHKLSQWLAYSLIEPLAEAGVAVVDLDALTALPEYRNGGLLIDLGVLQPLHDGVLRGRHTADSEIVVEWRALTVAVIDILASQVRARLGVGADRLPLAKILEGGTWEAGRRIARAKRADGRPPIAVDSDGTIF
ncbi:MAG: URC4/urg3 family protein [Pseudomonadota bacterium]